MSVGGVIGFYNGFTFGYFHVPPRRVEALQELLQNVVSTGFNASARCLSRLTDMLASMGLALADALS